MARPILDTPIGVSLGETLVAAVDQRAAEERRSRSGQVLFLCERALDAPVPPPLDDDHYRDGDLLKRFQIQADQRWVDRVKARAKAQGEDFSEAVRALLVAGLALTAPARTDLERRPGGGLR